MGRNARKPRSTIWGGAGRETDGRGRTRVKLAPEEVNTDWVDPRAWTETHDMFLWVVILAAVILIGYAAVRSLRKSARAPDA